jgi:hypothetical protein
MVPSAEYEIRRTYLYQPLAGKSFVKDAEIDSPIVNGGDVEIACPNCGDIVKAPVFKIVKNSMPIV